ncbi:unnamed protein product [Hermetia illucens]|uniref:Uncharacterized protein n=1 Tax=Hermetia illucens TaxID=343691 RepID=A0A7R8UDG8_HERIL|nr:unnamed protein product [Hermetia illucens]
MAQVESADLNLDDILNVNLMPSALFLHQDVPVISNNSVPEVKVKGDFSKAYELMGFHRKMMNEYQCNNFIVKQIMLEIGGPTMNSSLYHRIGTPAEGENSTYPNMTTTRQAKMIPNGELLYDSGSSGYKNWLSKTTTLDDIYRQFSSNSLAVPSNNTLATRSPKGKDPNLNRRNSYGVDELTEDDYEEGDITGYAVQQPMPIQQTENLGIGVIPGRNIAEIPLPVPYPTAGSKNGYYPSGHDEYEEGYGTDTYGPSAGYHSKELGLKDVMEIAMTTLAYLSFGMFILQVLMCITMDKSNNMMMMPMEAPDGGSEVEEIRRKKRSIMNERLLRINEITRRVLLSMDAVTYVEEDGGHCLFRVLCENNNFARNQQDRQKYWIPVWGLGLSWLSSRMARPNTPTNMRLASLKASVFGLGGADCAQTYSACDLDRMAANQRKENEKLDAESNDFNFRWGL